MSAEHASSGISTEFAFAQQVLCRVFQTENVPVGVIIFGSAITGFTLCVLSATLNQVNSHHAHGVTSTCPFISGCGPQLYG
jgi:hypothetical protein